MDNERLKILLYNAIVLLEEDYYYNVEILEDEMGITKNEYNEIMKVN